MSSADSSWCWCAAFLKIMLRLKLSMILNLKNKIRCMEALSCKLFLKAKGEKRGYSATLKVLGFVLFFSIAFFILCLCQYSIFTKSLKVLGFVSNLRTNLKRCWFVGLNFSLTGRVLQCDIGSFLWQKNIIQSIVWLVQRGLPPNEGNPVLQCCYVSSHSPSPQIRSGSSLEESVVFPNGCSWNLCDPVSSQQKFHLLGAPMWEPTESARKRIAKLSLSHFQRSVIHSASSAQISHVQYLFFLSLFQSHTKIRKSGVF